MDSLSSVKEWINQNAPALAGLYQNRYVGMMYDNFASLPAKKQKQVVLGIAAGGFFLVCLILLSFYITYWTYVSNVRNADSMVNMLTNYQRNRRIQDTQLEVLERNNQLSATDALKTHLVKLAQSANISPRMVKSEEKADAGATDPKAAPEMKAKQAMIKLDRINLTQLRDFLRNVESGPYNLNIASLQISNDDKIRGYMNVEVSVVAYLFHSAEEVPQ